jgi:hypothetical protein
MTTIACAGGDSSPADDYVDAMLAIYRYHISCLQMSLKSDGQRAVHQPAVRQRRGQELATI